MTPKILADALDCFWNAAIGTARDRQSLQAIEVADVMTAGFAAVANRLREHDEGESRRVSELLEANNRYQPEGRDARDDVALLRKALGAITDLSTALRQGGPAPEDLHDLSDALDTAITVALEALGETDPTDRAPQVGKGQASHPAAPWPLEGEENANAKRTGWAAFFAGHDREDCPFPPARPDLQRDYRVGWDAAKETCR